MRYLRIFGYEWLEGSIRKDLDSAGRGVWADILSLASISRRIGFIERSEGIPYTDQELSEKFKVDIKLLQKVISTCILEGRLAREPEYNTLFIVNWDKYQDYPLGSSIDLQQGKGRHKKPESEKGLGQTPDDDELDKQEAELLGKEGEETKAMNALASEYGKIEFDEALKIAEEKGKVTVPYLRGILKRRKEKRDEVPAKKNPRALPTKYTRPEDL